MPIIGAHVSTAGGLAFAIDNAQAIGAKSIQIFGASPRQWHASLPDPKAVLAYQAKLKKSMLGPVFLHAAYLPNLASPDNLAYKKSVQNLAKHLSIAETIGAMGLIFHPGSAKDTPRALALKQVAKGMKEVLKLVSGKTFLIIENTAGGGQKVGATLDDLAVMLTTANNPRVKICLDTAHALEGGLIESYTPALIKKLFDAFDEKIGLEQLVVFHANDSKTAYNSHHDRHENIGEGFIGRDGFKNLSREKRISHLPWILEVPGFKDEGPDKKNIDILNRLCA